MGDDSSLDSNSFAVLALFMNFANHCHSTVVDASVVAVRTTAPRAQEVPMVHRQRHLQAASLRAVLHPPAWLQEFLRSQIRLLCHRHCQ